MRPSDTLSDARIRSAPVVRPGRETRLRRTGEPSALVRARQNVERFIRERPVPALLIALGAGLGVGKLLGHFLGRARRAELSRRRRRRS